MAYFGKSNVDSPPHSPTSMSSDSGYPSWRKTSTSNSSSSSSSSSSSPTTPPGALPKVQLVPYARTASFERSFSDAERELLDKAEASLDALDLSSQDFDFEDIFTYDKPQKELNRVVEVSRPTRVHRDWSNFSFSHYPAAMSARNKVNNHWAKNNGGIGGLYVKNSEVKRKH